MVPEEDRVPEDDGMAPVGAGAATGAAIPQEAEVTTRVKNALEASSEWIKRTKKKKNRTQEDCKPRQRESGEIARQQRLDQGQSTS